MKEHALSKKEGTLVLKKRARPSDAPEEASLVVHGGSDMSKEGMTPFTLSGPGGDNDARSDARGPCARK